MSIGEDGPSQMALEDIAMFRSLPGCTVFYPSDAVSTERAVELAANTRGICFVRVSRPATAVIYPNDEKFEIGKAKIVRRSDSDQVLVIASGITLSEAMKAADTLASQGVNVRVMDPFTIKPLDVGAVREHAAACGGRVVTVEDHYPEGGIGDAVLDAVAETRNVVVKKLAVNAVPRSGTSCYYLCLPGSNSPVLVMSYLLPPRPSHGAAGHVRYLCPVYRQGGAPDRQAVIYTRLTAIRAIVNLASKTPGFETLHKQTPTLVCKVPLYYLVCKADSISSITVRNNQEHLKVSE